MRALWPSLPFDAWRDTKETLHRYSQIVGKIQLALTPVVSHFWNVTLRVTAHGLATSALPYEGRTFDIELDFVEHRVAVRTSDSRTTGFELRPRAVADFYSDLMAALATLGIRVAIWDHPVELKSEPIPFRNDRVHASYDREYVARFFRVVSLAAEIFEEHRSRFTGKCSGVGFYWGTFDLSVARYSGRRVPDAPTTNAIEREAYGHEVSEVGFWPGDVVYQAPAFFALHYPAPAGYTHAAVRPNLASWQAPSNCFVLPYETVRQQPDPFASVLEFCETTYEAGATLAGWNREELERPARPEGRAHAG